MLSLLKLFRSIAPIIHVISYFYLIRIFFCQQHSAISMSTTRRLPNYLHGPPHYLVNLDILENCSNKLTSSPVTQRPTKHAQNQRNQKHVPKVKCCLNQPIHTRFECKVINRIQEHVQSRRPSRIECRPLPQVVL